MKLLLISMNYSPELTGIGKYSGEMATGLAARGHEVRVVCAPPYYPAWQISPPYNGWQYTRQMEQPGVAVYRCPVWVPRKPSAARRLLHQASFALSSFPVVLGLALFWRPQVVLVVAPATACAPAAWLGARISGAKSWLHVQDLELDAAFQLGFLSGQRLQRWALRAERGLLRAFDRVSTVSGRMLDKVRQKQVDENRTSLLLNWVDLSVVDPLADAAAAHELRATLGLLPSQKVLLFSGTMNRKQGLQVLLQAAQLLESRRDLVFVLCGGGEMRPALEAAAAGLGNVCFLDLRPAAELGALLVMADIHLLPQLRNAADLVMPSKLGGMLASGRPVIAGADAGSEIARFIEGCGVCVEPESASAFVQAVLNLCDDDSRRHQLGLAARQLAHDKLAFNSVLDGLDLELKALLR